MWIISNGARTQKDTDHFRPIIYSGDYDGSDYFPAFLNGMFNYAKPGDAIAGIPGFFISWGRTLNQDVTHAFDSNVDESQRDNLLAKQDNWKYKPTVFADLSDMRYQKNADDVKVWTYTPRLISEEHSEEMSAEVDSYSNGGCYPQKHTTRQGNNVQKQKQGVLG